MYPSWNGPVEFPLLQRLARIVEHPNFKNRDPRTQLEIKKWHSTVVFRHTNFLLDGLRKR